MIKMKILFLANHIYEESKPRFTRSNTGYAIMVKDIAESVAVNEEVYLITNAITPEDQVGKINIVSHRWIDIIRNIKFMDIFKALMQVFRRNENLYLKLRYVYYILDNGYVEKMIKKLKPDIVHIHDIGYKQNEYINICEKINQPYVVTLHLLIGFDNTTKSESNKLLEKRLLEGYSKNLTVISTGMKDKILTGYNVKQNTKITIIPNGTSVKVTASTIDIYEKHNIKRDLKIALCLGTISERKNQLQIVRAYSLLPQEIKAKLCILFLGNDKLDGELEEEISKLDIEGNLRYCGFVSRKDLASYYNEASLNIIASLNEGLGLSVIESFAYGIPTVLFADLDAVPDIFDENVALLVEERTDMALAREIEVCINKEWDKDIIKTHSNKFKLAEMSTKYSALYSEILNLKK
jgi:glycosyltransferase involved in cell wall biosynthesis